MLSYNIHQLKNEEAQERNIQKLLENLHEYLKTYSNNVTNKDDSKKVIVFAFSGHGKEEKSDRDSVAIVTYDDKLLSLKGDIMERVGVGLPSPVYKIL